MSGYYVSDEFRTNNLSLTPGGSTVIVELSNGETKVYDKVKNPTAYINAILNKNPNVINVHVDTKLVWSKNK